MLTRRDRLIWAGAAGLTALATAGMAGQRRHMKRIEMDPENALLSEPPSGRPARARSADGTQLHVEQFGSETGAPIVLAHGWTEMLSYWTYVIRDLSDRGFRVVAYDLRGHGQSEPAAGGDYSLARFGEDLEAVLDACVPEGERAVVVGHSLGAMSIAAWAEHHDVQARVRAAALLNTGVGDLIAEQLLIPLPWIAGVINKMIPPRILLGARTPLPRFSTPASAAAVRYVAFGPEASPAQVAFYERMLITCAPEVRSTVGISLSEMDLRQAVPRLTVPTLVVAGANDRLTPPSHARRIAAALPQLERLIVLPDTGHMGPLERPREISRAIVELAGEPAPGAHGLAPLKYPA
jgi:pimeloyl-ACP methyl ester carboxylesterase